MDGAFVVYVVGAAFFAVLPFFGAGREMAADGDQASGLNPQSGVLWTGGK